MEKAQARPAAGQLRQDPDRRYDPPRVVRIIGPGIYESWTWKVEVVRGAIDGKPCPVGRRTSIADVRLARWRLVE